MAPGHREQDVIVEGERVMCDDRQVCRMEGLHDGGSVGAQGLPEPRSVGAQGLREPWLQESRYNLLAQYQEADHNRMCLLLFTVAAHSSYRGDFWPFGSPRISQNKN